MTVPGSWPPSDPRSRLLFVALVLLFGTVGLTLLVGYAVTPHQANDFFAFDSYSRFVRQNPAAALYDQPRLARFQDLPQHKLFAFMYHPGMLLLVWPLAMLPFVAAYVLWIGIGLIACCVAVADRRHSLPLVLMVLVAPSTIWTTLSGQSSLLVAALLVGGLRLSPTRPWIGGMLLGLATYKPQLGVLVPVALIASGRWRPILSASLTASCVVALSALCFGAAAWQAWIVHLPEVVGVRTTHASDWAMMFATVSSTLTLLGMPLGVADTVQMVTLIAVVPAICWCFHAGRGWRDARALLPIAALGTATFLATPFAFIYDLPLFTASLLLFVAERRNAGTPFLFREVMAMVAGFLMPWILLSRALHCFGPVLLLLVLATIVARIRQLRRGTRLPAGMMVMA